MSKLLTNSEGKFWKDSSGRYLLERPLSEHLIQEGLEFYWAKNPNFLTINNGTVSEVYDIRGNGRYYSQPTVSLRPYWNVNTGNIEFTELMYSGLDYYKSVKSGCMFIVTDKAGSFPGGNAAIGIGFYFYHGVWVNYSGVSAASSLPFYQNLNKCNQSVITLKPQLLAVNNILYNGSCHVGSLYDNGTSLARIPVMAFGFYNRLLTDFEMIHLINALKATCKI